MDISLIKHLILTDDAVEDPSQCLVVFQSEDMSLIALLRGQLVQLRFLHIFSNAKHIDI